MKSDLPWKEHGKSEEMTESGETGVHKGGEGGGGQKRLERLAAEKTESGGKPGRRECTGQAWKPLPRSGGRRH